MRLSDGDLTTMHETLGSTLSTACVYDLTHMHTHTHTPAYVHIHALHMHLHTHTHGEGGLSKVTFYLCLALLSRIVALCSESARWFI